MHKGVLYDKENKMKKPEFPTDETICVDNCICVYCGYLFNGRNAMNADMDETYVTCPKCGKEMKVFISVSYVCTPLED